MGSDSFDSVALPPRNNFEKSIRFFFNIVDGPITWFRESVVERNRPKYYYYHRQFRRVPTIDECYERDVACSYEANTQFKRDRKVDTEIVTLLRQRKEDCIWYEKPDHREKCKKVFEDYDQASLNWFIKYGDLGPKPHVKTAYMKQKHRMIWERRHGPNDGSNKINSNEDTN